jgi:hypothetical protein
MNIYLLRSRGQPKRGGPQAWGLGVGLKIPRREKISWLRNVKKDLGPEGSCEQGDEPTGSKKCWEVFD